MTELRFVVHGKPIGQGRISTSSTGQGYHSNGKLLRPWRKQIADTIKAQLDPGQRNAALPGALTLDAWFYFRPPIRMPKGRWAPHVRPDGDHLLRALADAVVLSGLVVDDAQFVDMHTRKRYGDQPGVTFTIREATPA